MHFGPKTGILGPKKPKNAKISTKHLREANKVMKTIYESTLVNY